MKQIHFINRRVPGFNFHGDTQNIIKEAIKDDIADPEDESLPQNELKRFKGGFNG